MRKDVLLWLLSSAVNVLCPLTHGLTFHSMPTGLVWCKKFTVYGFGELTLAGLQVPTKGSLSLPSSAGWGGKYNKGLRVKIRAGSEEHSPNAIMHNRFFLGKLIYYKSIPSRIMRNKS